LIFVSFCHDRTSICRYDRTSYLLVWYPCVGDGSHLSIRKNGTCSWRVVMVRRSWKSEKSKEKNIIKITRKRCTIIIVYFCYFVIKLKLTTAAIKVYASQIAEYKCLYIYIKKKILMQVIIIILLLSSMRAVVKKDTKWEESRSVYSITIILFYNNNVIWRMDRECQRTTGTRGRLVRTGIPRARSYGRAESVHETYPLLGTIDVVLRRWRQQIPLDIHNVL